jgi:hypothetical protein
VQQSRFLVESEALAGRMKADFDRNLDRFAWHVTRGEDGGLIWKTIDDDGAVISLDVEPGLSWPKRMAFKGDRGLAHSMDALRNRDSSHEKADELEKYVANFRHYTIQACVYLTIF